MEFLLLRIGVLGLQSYDHRVVRVLTKETLSLEGLVEVEICVFFVFHEQGVLLDLLFDIRIIDCGHLLREPLVKMTISDGLSI